MRFCKEGFSLTLMVYCTFNVNIFMIKERKEKTFYHFLKNLYTFLCENLMLFSGKMLMGSVLQFFSVPITERFDIVFYIRLIFVI